MAGGKAIGGIGVLYGECFGNEPRCELQGKVQMILGGCNARIRPLHGIEGGSPGAKQEIGKQCGLYKVHPTLVIEKRPIWSGLGTDNSRIPVLHEPNPVRNIQVRIEVFPNPT